MPDRNRLATAIQTGSMEPDLGINKMIERSINKGACQPFRKTAEQAPLTIAEVECFAISDKDTAITSRPGCW
jgi:hypothetical protein